MTNFKFLNIFSGFWTTKIVTKNAIRCILGWNLLNKTQGLNFLCRNLYGILGCQISKLCVFILVPGPKIVTKNGTTFVLRWNWLNKTFISPFWVEIFMGGSLRTQNFKILSTSLSFKYKIFEQKSKQICSTLK
jgi:hypothetical protein